VVFVDESAEEVAPLDRLGVCWIGLVGRFWRVEFECAVWPLAVVVRRVGAEHVFEVSAAEDEQPVEAFGADEFANPTGWGAAATASTAALAAVFFVLITLDAALAYSIAGSGDDRITSALNDLAWAVGVMASFPAAMLIMAGTFGLWRAGIVSDMLFWGRACSRHSHPDRRNDVGERRNLGTGWCLFAVHHADHLPCLGGARQRAPLRTGSLRGARA
jgi:hypothetical protein